MALKWNKQGDWCKPQRKSPSSRCRMTTTEWQYIARLYHEAGMPCPIVPPTYADRAELYWLLIWARVAELKTLHDQMMTALDAWEAANPIEARMTPWWESRQRVKEQGIDEDLLHLQLAVHVQQQFHLTALGGYTTWHNLTKADHHKERTNRNNRQKTIERRAARLQEQIDNDTDTD